MRQRCGRVPDLPGTDFAMRQMRRKPRGRGLAGDSPGPPDSRLCSSRNVMQPGLRRRFADLPVLLELLRPSRSPISGIDVLAASSASRCCRGSGVRRRDVALPQRIPERRVDRIRPAGLGCDVERLDQHVAGEALRLAARRAFSSSLIAAVQLPLGRPIAPVPEHSRRAVSLDGLQQRRALHAPRPSRAECRAAPDRWPGR